MNSENHENNPYIVYPVRSIRKQFKELGIKIIPSPPCGTYVELPDGWTFKTETGWIVESTSIYDCKGRRRIYSAHFFPVKRYVQDDILSIDTRYRVQKKEVKNEGDNWLYHHVVCVDFADGSEIFDAGTVRWNKSEPLTERCEAYLNENYPDWKNPLAYWD